MVDISGCKGLACAFQHLNEPVQQSNECHAKVLLVVAENEGGTTDIKCSVVRMKDTLAASHSEQQLPPLIAESVPTSLLANSKLV